jgi:uncharacterized protein
MASRDLPHDTAAPGGLERFRAVRRELEAAVLPRASSLDGRTFAFQASLHGLELQLGGYVVVGDGDAGRLGQVLALEPASMTAAELDMPPESGGAVRAAIAVRHAVGEGALLDDDGAAFHDAPLRPATPHEVAARLARTRRSGLVVGELARAPGVPGVVDPRGFDRHTFLCGQSGSGKTHALGVVLEQLLLDTRLRIVVLDPNSDFTRLGDVRAGVDAALGERYGAVARSVAVHSAAGSGGERLRLRFSELEAPAQAALLRLDPVADREEYAELEALLAAGRPPTVDALEATARSEARQLALRVSNLGVGDYGVWSRGDPGSVLDAVGDSATRCVVVDLGALSTPDEQALVSTAVLDELWRRRERREPVLIVVDEAHNVCPASPRGALAARATEAAIRIAAEGRKFGLYLLLSTQRPQKLPENVVSQCDNLILMRLNSKADALFAQSVFSFVPPRLVGLAPGFRLGESLMAGRISRVPAIVRFGARLSEEGGADIPATWAEPVAPVQ